MKYHKMKNWLALSTCSKSKAILLKHLEICLKMLKFSSVFQLISSKFQGALAKLHEILKICLDLANFSFYGISFYDKFGI